ncbi:MAG: 6,7-dimethyl-8-ribityllumazine synthase, partial [Candidatus Binatia bacterium]
AFEIPLFAHKMAASGKYTALVCLGAVIRGETPHFEYISAEVSRGIANAMIEHRIPIAFGVLTTDTLEQAVERSGTKMGNKGYEAALTAIEMASLSREVS